LWAQSIKKEVDFLVDMKYFEFKGQNIEFQFTTLHMVFDVKQRAIEESLGGWRASIRYFGKLSVYSSTVKGISVRLLHVIAHKMDLKQM
jgi:hypothetical protein